MLTAKFFHNCSTHPNPLFFQIGNYTSLDLHVQFRKYIQGVLKLKKKSVAKRLTTKFFHNCSTQPNPLVFQIRNYISLDLHVQYRKYLEGVLN